jgi:hypothetical protein
MIVLALLAAAFLAPAGQAQDASDVVVRSVALASADPRVGERIAVKVTFENRGSTASPAGKRFACYSVANDHGGFCPILEVDLPTIGASPPGGTTEVIVTAGPATAPGSYTLTVDPLTTNKVVRGGVTFQVWPEAKLRVPILDAIAAPAPPRR